MNSAAYRFLTLIVVLFLVSIGRLQAQTAVTGGIEGNVTDASGAAISGATVEATNVGKAVTEKTVTNDRGAYRFPSLIPGSYTVTVDKQGFAQYVRGATHIDTGILIRIDAVLPVGGGTAKVEVTGELPLLQTDSPEVSETIRANEIEALPLFGNNITRLVLLAPGVSMPSGQLDLHPENSGSDFNVNINGAPPNANGHLLDGVENTEAIQGLSLIVPSQDAVQEVKLTTSNYDAEYGKVAGGLWQVTTKSGTNAFHGSLFEYYRTAGFFAADHFSEPNGVPGNRWNQFGGSIGGPILKDKLFFFGDYQGMRNNLHASGNETVPIDAFRTGDFSSVAATDPIYDPATGNADGTGRTQFDGCPGDPVLNKICPDRLSSAAKNLLALLPEPTSPGFSSNYQVSRPATFDQNQFDTRVDYFATSKTVIFGKFSYFHATFFTPTAYGVAGGGPPLGGVGVANAGNSDDNDKQFMFNYQHTFSPSLLTDARFGFSRIVISELQLDANSNAATEAGIPDINLGTVYTSGLPQINVSDPLTPFNMGDFGLPFFEHETNFEFYNNWTKTSGHHSFKFGADIAKFFGIRTDVSGRGLFQVSQSMTQLNDTSCTGTLPPGDFCGSGLAALELGLTSNFGRDITLVQPQEKLWKYAFYGQDTWQVNPRLTLTLGLRWDYMSPIFTPKGESVGNLDVSTNNILLTNLAGKYAGVTTPKTEYSPRLGLAFRLTKNDVLRGGFGRSYFMNADGAGFGTQGCCWPIKQSQNDVVNNPYGALPYTLDQGPGLPPPLPTFPPNGQISFQNAPGGSIYFVGKGTNPHSYQDTYNLTLEHAFPYQITASIAYVGNIGRHLWDNVDINMPPPGPGTYDSRRPYFTSYGWGVEEYQRSNAPAGYPEMRSNYNSLQLHAEKRFHQGLYLLTNFTWARSLDDGTFGPGDGNGNQFCYACNYGPSGTVRPWSWTSAVNWDLPFGNGRPYANSLSRGANAVVGGWALSGLFNFEAGQPFTPYYVNSPTVLNSPIYDRPDLVGNPHVSNPNRNEWYNPAAYAQPAQYTFGDAGRNSLTGPGYGEVDLSMTKSFAITERTHLDLRWDVFNALNRVNLNTPTGDGAAFVDVGNAGVITSIVDFRRRMQIGAHLTF